MKKILLYATFFLGLFAWQSCEYDWVVPEKQVLPDVVSYSADIQPIWDANCISCHKAGGFNPDLTAANSYNNLFAENLIDTITPENSVLYVNIAPSGSMNAYSDAGDPELVLQWIQEGALNN